MFGWLRAKARDAVLCGIADAVEELHRDGQDEGARIARLRQITAAPAPALPEPEPTIGRRKKAE